MKKVFSETEFTFKVDGETSVDLSKKGTLVSDEIAVRLRKIFVEKVTIEEVKAPEKKAKKEDKVDSEGDKDVDVHVETPKKEAKKDK